MVPEDYASDPQLPICDGCFSTLEPFESEITHKTIDPQSMVCCLCKTEAYCNRLITHMTLPREIVLEVESQISACAASGCCPWIDNVGGDYTLYTEYTELYVALESVTDKPAPGSAVRPLIAAILENAGVASLDLTGVKCPNCGRSFLSWDEMAVLEPAISLLDIPPLPNDGLSLPIKLPQAQIEFHRPDCSPYLVHLMRPGLVATEISTVTGLKKLTPISAASLLWVILKQRTLKASKGKGMHAPAVCFTVKSLPAIKETLIGHEAAVRRKSGSLNWSPYGLMFHKEYLIELGIRPVISADECPSGVEPSLYVRFDAGVNWAHEREWRSGTDVTFNPNKTIVLVPDFDSVRIFAAILNTAGITVKGILPLLNICAWT